MESGKTVACGIVVGISTESKATGIRKGQNISVFGLLHAVLSKILQEKVKY